jgi:hypothetical protein
MNNVEYNLLAYVKEPNEVLPISVKFISVSDRHIKSSEAVATKWKRELPENVESANTIMISSFPIIESPNSVRILLTGGDDGYDYKISITAILDNDDTLCEEVFVRVRQD